jgi:DNA polymerase-3 subunit epsilon
MGKKGILPGASLRGDNFQQEVYIRSLLKDVKNRVQLDTNLHQIRFLVIDLETTGFRHWQGDEIISIGAVPVEQGKVHSEQIFHTYVRPLRAIPESITQLTGITMDDVKEAPELEQALKAWLSCVHGSTLVAYGVQHDLGFLQPAMSKYWGTRLHNRVIDAYQIAQWLHPTWEDHSLERALINYDIRIEKRHTADGDALMTAKLWANWIEILIEKGLQTLEDLYVAMSRGR